jgi:hypothetical protein
MDPIEEVISWLREQGGTLEYGEIQVAITVHQGVMVGIETQVKEKKRFSPAKKENPLYG